MLSQGWARARARPQSSRVSFGSISTPTLSNGRPCSYREVLPTRMPPVQRAPRGRETHRRRSARRGCVRTSAQDRYNSCSFPPGRRAHAGSSVATTTHRRERDSTHKMQVHQITCHASYEHWWCKVHPTVAGKFQHCSRCAYSRPATQKPCVNILYEKHTKNMYNVHAAALRQPREHPLHRPPLAPQQNPSPLPRAWPCLACAPLSPCG